MDDDDVGNRFHPTDQQLILHYLEGKMEGNDFPNVIGEIDICKFEPWDLPARAAWQSNDPEWYFFSKPDYKYAKSKRVNRRTTDGHWKPTGKDRSIWDRHGREIGIKKNLVYYRGCFNNGTKTNWVIHEFHSHNADSYQKPYVLCRLIRKADDDGSDTGAGPSHQTVSQGNPQLYELESLPDESELDYDFLSDMLSQMNPAAQGHSYSTGSNYEPNTWRSHVNTSNTAEQEEEPWNFVWTEGQGGADLFEETVDNSLYDFNPPESLRQVYAGDSSYTNAEMAYSQQWGNVLETRSFLSGNSSSNEHTKIYMAQAPQSKIPSINCIQLHCDKFPVETRTSKAQNLPKSHNIKKKSASEKLYLQGKVLNKAIFRDEVRDDGKLAIDLPQKRNSTVKYVKDKRIAQSGGEVSSKMRPDGSNGSRKGYIIFLETPPFGHKPNPPSVCICNILIAVVLFIFMIRELESLH